MVETELITLGIIFFFAIIGGIIANRFKQPIVLGLLLVGSIIGPFSLNLVNDPNMTNLLIEFGAILLLFVIGLEFSIQKLLKVGFKSMMIAVFKVGITFFLSFTASMLFGLTLVESIFIGIILSFTSTVVVAKILEQKELIRREEVQILMAVLIIEDFFAVIALTFFSGMNSVSGQSLLGLLEHVGIGALVLVAVYILASKFAERIVVWLMKNSGEEVITFLSLGICAGFSYLAYWLGLTPSAGAFLAGSIVASFKESKVFEHAIKPYTLIFSSLFFIAIGTLINFAEVQKYVLLIGVLLVVLIVTRFLSVGLTTYIFANFKGEQTLFSSVAMLSVGEFSLLIAKQAGAFGTSIDLVTISSIIVFLTAVLMSLTIGIGSKLPLPRAGSKNHIMNFSNYIQSMFEELDNESAFTKKFKDKFFSFLKITPIVLVALFGFRRAIMYLFHLGTPMLMIYVAYLLGLTLIVGIGIYVYDKYTELHNILVQVVVNLDQNRSIKRTSAILGNATKAFTILAIGLYSPFIVFFLGLPELTLAGSAMLIAVSIYYFIKIFRLIGNFNSENRYSVPSYRKYDVKAMRFKDQ